VKAVSGKPDNEIVNENVYGAVEEPDSTTYNGTPGNPTVPQQPLLKAVLVASTWVKSDAPAYSLMKAQYTLYQVTAVNPVISALNSTDEVLNFAPALLFSCTWLTEIGSGCLVD
jgi:hypothetical protein